MKNISQILLLFVGLIGCTEPFDIATEVRTGENIETFLVVQATLTNELKQQEVLLGKGRSFANDSIQPVAQNASVSVIDANGFPFLFAEIEPGRYLSNESFRALPNIAYQLNIETSEGNTYASELEFLPEKVEMTAVYAERITNDLGVEGIAIYTDSEILQGAAPFLRYQYEETYKVIAPLWSPFDMVVVDPNPPYSLDNFDLVPREQEERVCYGTQRSNRIIQALDLNRSGNKVGRNLVRFISRDNFIISHRYSILVKQLVQAPDAYSFYRTLNVQSGSEGVFTEIQPGFIEGNVSNTNDSDEKVLGYFEVANQSQERIFFNYEDFFPDEALPPYALSCSFLGAPPVITPAGTSPLKDAIDSGSFVYVRDNDGEVSPPAGPYLTARSACGDCTVLGSNLVPDFWIE